MSVLCLEQSERNGHNNGKGGFFVEQFAKNLRGWFSPDGVAHFDDIALGRKLGTVANIRAIGNMYADLARHAVENEWISSVDLIARIQELTEFFAQTRGKLSCSIVTAMDIMTKGLSGYADKPLEDTVHFLIEAYPAYEAVSAGWLGKIKDYSASVIQDFSRVLLFDYSSTVASLLQGAAEHGKKLEVYIPCSGVLYGGRQYVLDAVKYGHKPFFFQDAAMLHFIEQADAAFIGSESIFPDGGAANSVGSDIVSVLCKACKTPLYVCSTMLKYNPAYLDGAAKKTGTWDLRERMPVDLPQEVRDATDFVSLNLTQIQTDAITAFITELGVIPAHAMFEVGNHYLKNWKE